MIVRLGRARGHLEPSVLPITAELKQLVLSINKVLLIEVVQLVFTVVGGGVHVILSR